MTPTESHLVFVCYKRLNPRDSGLIEYLAKAIIYLMLCDRAKALSY